MTYEGGGVKTFASSDTTAPHVLNREELFRLSLPAAAPTGASLVWTLGITLPSNHLDLFFWIASVRAWNNTIRMNAA